MAREDALHGGGLLQNGLVLVLVELERRRQVLLARLVRAVAHPAIRMQLDTGALAINGEDPETVLADCAAYLWHRNAFWFGLGLALSFAFEAILRLFEKLFVPWSRHR